jgi:hypothetical protein
MAGLQVTGRPTIRASWKNSSRKVVKIYAAKALIILSYTELVPNNYLEACGVHNADGNLQ